MTTPDYVTVEHTLDPHKFLVVVYSWHSRDEQYLQKRVSQPHPKVTAEGLAQSWAAALGVEVK